MLNLRDVFYLPQSRSLTIIETEVMNDVLLRVINAIIIAHFIRKPPTSEQKKVGGFQMYTPKGCRTAMDTGPKPLAGLTECYDF